MKHIIVILFVLIITVSTSQASSWTDRWTINGIPLSNLKNSTGSEKLQFILGVASGYAAHWLGHVVYLNIEGTNWKQDGLNEVIQGDYDPTTFGLSGFGTQLICGTIVKKYNIGGTMYNTGFQVANFMEIVSYPLMYDFGTNKDTHEFGDLTFNGSPIAWSGFALWSLFNLDIESK